MDELIILISFWFGAVLIWAAGYEKSNRWDR